MVGAIVKITSSADPESRTPAVCFEARMATRIVDGCAKHRAGIQQGASAI
jgi:hypothetical protein